MSDTLTFAHPVWLYLIPALGPVALLRLRCQRFRSEAINSLIAPRLRHRLLLGHRLGSHWGRFSLQLLALACVLTALARPQFGVIEEKVFTQGRNVILAMDTSRSMLASDIQPNRIIRAALAAQDLVASLPEDRIGLIAFAGTSFLQAPLTVDHDAIIESLNQLDTEIIPRGGTNIGRAVALARETFREAGSDNNALIIFSDGEDLEDQPLRAPEAPDTEEKQMIVIAIGVGTSAGSIIPDPGAEDPGQFIRDTEGNVVRTRLDAAKLKEITGQSGGLYLELDSTGAVEEVVTRALDRLDVTRAEGKSISKPIERYRWPLAIGIAALLVSLIPARAASPLTVRQRRPGSAGASASASVPAASTLILFLAAIPAQAAKDPGPYEEYEAGKYESAIEKYLAPLEDSFSLQNSHELYYGAGSSAYKLGDYQQAIRSYGNALLSEEPAVQEKAHYSLGNTLYREGETGLTSTQDAGPGQGPDIQGILDQWYDAVNHYEAALRLNEDNEDASHNLELVKKRIEELEQMQEQQQQNQQNQEKNEGEEGDPQEQQQGGKGDQEQESKSNQDQEEGKGQDQQQQNQQGDQQDGDQKNQDQQSGQDEQAPSEPQQEQPAPEGQLEADRDRPQQAQAEPGQEQPHPETGFTRSQARQILRALADEDLDVRPLIPPDRAAVFKDW